MTDKLKFNPLTPPFDKVRDDIADLTNKSHTDLDDIGVHSHDEIDTHIEGNDWVRTTNGGTLYVRSTGNDSTGDGSIGTPYLTIQKTFDVLSSAPSLLGNIIINIEEANTFTEDLTIPSLVYNGFSVTIQGLLSEVLGATTGGTSSAATVYNAGAGVYGHITKTGAGWTTNAYQRKLLYNADTDMYTPIVENSTTSMKYVGHSAFFNTIAVTTGTWKVYDWSTIINGRITMTPGAVLIINDTKISTTTTVLSANGVPYCLLSLYRCWVEATSDIAIIFQQLNEIIVMHSVVTGRTLALASNASILNTHNSIYFRTIAGSSYAIIARGGGELITTLGLFIGNNSKTAGDIGLQMIAGTSSAITRFFIDNWTTGIKQTACSALPHSNFYKFTNCTTDQTNDITSYYGT